MECPRPEYPRPQLMRGEESWMNLNGPWTFCFDRGDSGMERRFYENVSWPDSRTITVPFCPESRLSGIADTDFASRVWYRRTVTLQASFAGKRILLHIGACDYRCDVWVNGRHAGQHTGGYASFSFEITPYLEAGENTITVSAFDDTRSVRVPSGKQSDHYESYVCMYTRTTGIWQTVWLEAVPEVYLADVKITPDASLDAVYLEAAVNAPEGSAVTAVAYAGETACGGISMTVSGGLARGRLTVSEPHLWSPDDPYLYGLTVTAGDDTVKSYFGLRRIAYENGRLKLNGHTLFQRLILDQGFYPDGIYTAPTDAELIADIRRSMAMGFNGARLHQKVFEPRFLYHCDRLGYLVWGEYGSWGTDLSGDNGWEAFLPEWMEVMARDVSHPALIGWCPLNETVKEQNPVFVRTLYRLTKRLDGSRPVIDTSGYVHVETDIPDFHDYDQNPVTFAERYRDSAITFLSEYGGIRWNSDGVSNGWGYGEGPKTEAEFLERYRGLTEALLDNPRMCAFCYTQLTDVEQETNGLYTYDRHPKFDPALLYAINRKKAAIEDD